MNLRSKNELGGPLFLQIAVMQTIFVIPLMKLAANALTTILYLLAVHKDVQKNEILRVLGDNLMLSVERQKELKYINMVINENLRLYPPLVFIFNIVRKYEVSLPADSSIHKDKLRIVSDGSGTMGLHPIPLIFKRRTD
ncbi:23095_t:CDS:2 [Rhizophagus irregularis]|nr:23095_t:CDS:2 [Rhizophagus irregularis]